MRSSSPAPTSAIPTWPTKPFWQPLIEVIDWAWDNVTSTLCSCLATHAVMQFRHGQTRVKQPHKIWGVFEHRVTDGRHPLVADVNTRFDVPHSRWNDVSRAQFEAAGLKVLVESAEAGVHLAVSRRRPAHRVLPGPSRIRHGVAAEGIQARPAAGRVRQAARVSALPGALLQPPGAGPAGRIRPAALQAGETLAFPEAHLLPLLDNTWHDTAEAVIGNWIGCVYQVTHRERGLPFMPGIDPNNPLGLA